MYDLANDYHRHQDYCDYDENGRYIGDAPVIEEKACAIHPQTDTVNGFCGDCFCLKMDRAEALLDYMETHQPHWLANIERCIARGTDLSSVYLVAVASEDDCPF